jgi:hypothetical protein
MTRGTFMRTLGALVVTVALLTGSAVAVMGQDPGGPTPTDELLAGMVTEEVEPGVFRVVHDGVRDLTSADNRDIAAGYDDGIWLLRKNGFLRLGDDGSHGWPTVFGPEGRDFEVGPHGTVWTIPDRWYGAQSTGQDIYRSADGEEWTVQPCPDDCVGVTLAPDGRAWASSTDEDGRRRVGLVGSRGYRQPLDGTIPADGFGRLLFTDSGDRYGVELGWVYSVYLYEDDTWHHTHDFYSAVDVGPDGTVWGTEGDRWHDGLARFADGEWTRWTHDELPEMAWSRGGGMGFGIGLRAFLDDEFRVAPDGSLWARLWRSGDSVGAVAGGASVQDWEQRFYAVEDGRAACDGLVRFDGETVDHFLAGRCISMDIAADGSVWALADAEDGGDLYVITPEAVAATE